MSEDVSEFHKEIIEGLATLKQVTSDILEQTKKTNGRVTLLEGVTADHATQFAVIYAGTARTSWWKDKVGTAFIGLIFTVIGAAVLLVLQKTEIVDISVVDAEQFEQLP